MENIDTNEHNCGDEHQTHTCGCGMPQDKCCQNNNEKKEESTSCCSSDNNDTNNSGGCCA